MKTGRASRLWWLGCLVCILLLSLGGSVAEAAGLGIGIRPIYADDKLRLNLPDTAGCIVASVPKGSGGDLMGLRLGDVIREFNGEPVVSVPKFLQQVQQAPAIQKIVVWRDGQAMSLAAATSGSGTPSAPTTAAAPERVAPLEGFLGIEWNTSPAALKQLLQERGGFTYASTGGSEKELQAIAYKGTFAGRPADIVFGFYGGKFYNGTVFLRSPTDDILKNYDALARDISDKYGPANRRTGRYLELKTIWLFPIGQDPVNAIVLDITRSSGTGPAVFFLRLDYTYGVLRKAIEDKKGTSVKKDL
jgi:hypothetical protein